MHLNFKALRQFVCVAKHESVSRAAEELHISPSPLSRAILKFEADIGFALFERVGKGIRLTTAGRDLLKNARSLLEINERFMQDVRRWGQGEGGTISIGQMPGALYNGLVTAAAKKVRADSPLIHFQFEGMPEADQLIQLQLGRLDFSIQTRPADDASFVSEQFAAEKYVLLLPKGHALCSKSQIGIDELAEAEWIVTPERTGESQRSRFLAACKKAGFEPNIACVAGDIMSALALISNDFGICAAQESLARFCGNEIEVRPLELLEMQVKFYLVWRPEAITPASAQFIKALRNEGKRE